MRKNNLVAIRYLPLCISLLLTLSLSAQSFTKYDEVLIDSTMCANYHPKDPGAVLLVVQNGVPVFRKAYGMASMKLQVPMKEENVFRIASVSKQFTAVCVLQLAQAGKLDVKDDIRKYLPAYNSHGRIITIENLLYQTSGILSFTEKGDYESVMTTPHTPEQIMNYFMNDSLLFEPGTDWSYSNSNYVLLGMIVEKISGITLAKYYHQHIFLPLGMTHSAVLGSDSIIANAVNGYSVSDSGKFIPAAFEDPSWDFGCGDISSSVDDMAKWDNALYNDIILGAVWLQKAWTSFRLPNRQETHYGYGFGITNVNDIQFIEHGGNLRGFQSDILRIPSKHIYIVILSNNDGGYCYQIPIDIALRMTGVSNPKPSANYPDRKILAQDTGVYLIHRFAARVTWNFTPEKQYRMISIKGDSLYAQPTAGEKEVLLYVSNDLFIGKQTQMMYHFIRNKKGKVEALEYYSEPIRYGPDDLEFRK